MKKLLYSAILFLAPICLTGCESSSEASRAEGVAQVPESEMQARNDLMIGSTGDDLDYLHEQLIALDFLEAQRLHDEVDFGEVTQFYVMAFQITQSLEPNGFVDAAVWSAIEDPVEPTEEAIAAAIALIPIDDGDTGEDALDTKDSSASDMPQPSGKYTVYLTFDDGPHPTYTPQIIALLKKYNARSTFFALGQNVDTHTPIAKDLVKSGQDLGNHTYTHLDITKASEAVVRDDIKKTQSAIFKATDLTPTCFRPPYGAITPEGKQKIAHAGGQTVMWDVDPQDWARPGAEEISEHILTYAQPGEVILLHDGGGDRTQTIAALETVLKEGTKRGWTFAAYGCSQ